MPPVSSTLISSIANIDLIKQVNCATIYKVIEQYAPISRVKIAKTSHLAPASVTKITRHLLERGIITETERQASTGGRCAISLAPNNQAINVIAIKIGRKLLSLSRYNLAGQKSVDKQINIENQNGPDLISLLIKEIYLLLNDSDKINQPIVAISITLSGLIDPKQGRVIYTTLHSLNNYPLVQVIEDEFSIPTFIGNHTRALALAEHYFGSTQDCQDSIVISIHHGVGSGIIVQGKALLGINFNIGEIGHIQVNPEGKKCHCGNIGCLETEVSDAVIIEKVLQALKQGQHSSVNINLLTIESIYDAAANADPLCQKVVIDAGRYLGKTIAMLINILNPEKIIIAGKITAAQKPLFSAISQCIEQQSLPEFHRNMIIQATELSANSTIASFALIKQALYEGTLLQSINIPPSLISNKK